MIRVSDKLRAEIEQHGVREFPHECCGVLIGDLAGDLKIVSEARPLPNTFEPSLEFEQSVDREKPANSNLPGQERRYMVSPDQMFQLMQEERRTKRKVLGFYHSHPNHPAIPSEFDREWASIWYTYIIVSIQSGEPAEMIGWQLNPESRAFLAEQIDFI